MQATMTTITTKTAKIVETISLEKMIEIFKGVNKTTFVQVRQTTKPTMNKKNNRFLNLVEKMNDMNCLVGFSYQEMVNNARARQFVSEITDSMKFVGCSDEEIKNFIKNTEEFIDDSVKAFVAKASTVGSHATDENGDICRTVLFNEGPKTGEWAGIPGYYLQTAIMSSSKPIYRWINNGTPLTDEEIEEMKEFFPEKTESKNQGLKKPYIIRSPRFETIKGVSLNKVRYHVI